MAKTEVVILGAGLMGRVAAYFFVNHPDGPIPVRLADRDEATLRSATSWLSSPLVESVVADAAGDLGLGRALEGTRVCISCIPYFLNPKVARAALRSRISMIDLGGNPEITDVILSMNEEARRKNATLIPDTGLAPGLTNILAWDLAHRFQACDEVHIRVGGLPQNPQEPLKYAQFFSIHGLLNEYLEDAREIIDGKEALVPSPSNVETLEFDALGTFEAFVTSGGTSTLPRTLLGKVKRLDYKTIRYPGHYAALTLLRDIGLTSTKKLHVGAVELTPREMLSAVIDEHLPKNAPDIVLVSVTARGDGGREERIEIAVRQDDARKLSAMGQMTSFPAAAIALAILQGKSPPGAHPQETVIPFSWMKDQLAKFGIEL